MVFNFFLNKTVEAWRCYFDGHAAEYGVGAVHEAGDKAANGTWSGHEKGPANGANAAHELVKGLVLGMGMWLEKRAGNGHTNVFHEYNFIKCPMTNSITRNTKLAEMQFGVKTGAGIEIYIYIYNH